MRRRVAGALCGVVVLAGCAAGGEKGRDPGREREPDGGVPAVSAEESVRVLREWAGRHNAAVASGDEDAWRGLSAGALQGALVARARTYGGLPEGERISLENPAFYVPRVSGYPRWFAAAALDEVGGAARQVLVVFERAKAGEAWRAVHLLPFQGRPPKLDYDGEGYAIAALDRSLPTGHAEYLASGERETFRPDRFTREARERVRRAPAGWSVSSRFSAGRERVYALRTDDGGSLVWYSVEQRQTFRGGGIDALPVDLRAYLTRTGRRSADRVEATWTWLAIGYAPPQGTTHVLGESVRFAGATV